ncbi:ribose 5-phosphate isomerase B [Roseiarcus fermentans]|uniref:Ribose 5-phosphate isomerase B n=1 Tax=Roseiarcus fermentans TaxID=1473586 RepID=A0A366F9H6_9HYPH|nr:RpiB/LacA/LacB family sugar-phosphate isomerase [Roseiarcus fermentans]RBP10419.1 ribose 5-phosphate isomerase B [Roseiarcus fermentans]
MRIGIASDHGGFALKVEISKALRTLGHEVVDFGARVLSPADDYPDYVIPLARSIVSGDSERGIAICGSGVGASIVANKIPGVRAGLIHDVFSARQGVEDDDMNVFCLGGRVIGDGLALQLVQTILSARFSGADRHLRRLAKVQAIEVGESEANGAFSVRRVLN